MNSTNRALNRIFLAIVGLAFLGVALTAIAWLVSAQWRSQSSEFLTTVVNSADHAFGMPLWHGTTVSGAALIALAVALLVIVLLIIFALRQGRGSTSELAHFESEDGSVSIDTAIAQTLLRSKLTATSGVASVNVSGYRVRSHHTALKVSITAKRGVSPRNLVEALDTSTEQLHEIVGIPLTVFGELVGGTRTSIRVDADHREHSSNRVASTP